MNWTRIFLFAPLTLCATGSMAQIGMYLCTYLFEIKNPFVMLAMQKGVAAAFTLPILFTVIFFRHAGGIFRRVERGIVGVFWVDRLKIDDKVCLVLDLVWLCGFLVQLIRTLRAQLCLERIWRENSPVVEGRRRAIFEEYRERFGLSRVELFENAALPSPVSAKRGSFMIVLPEQPYSEKELHMIFSHEMNHLGHVDLWWRRLVLIGGMIHWYHPWQRALEKNLIAEQEIVCDLRASTGHPAFTQKEYGTFLVGLSDYQYGNLPITAFHESKNITIRRLSAMTQAKKLKKPKGWLLAVSCAGLLAAALLPASAVSAQVIAWEEGRIYASENAIRMEPAEPENSGEVHTEYVGDDPTVTEVDLAGEEIETYSNMIVVDRLIPKSARVVYPGKRLSAGSRIMISVSCGDADAVYRIGVRNNDTGQMNYIEGSVALTYTYPVVENGSYSAYVENRSNRTIEVGGYIRYIE